MSKRLHLVFGGELEDPSKSKFKNIDEVELVGLYSDYESAYSAWKEASQKSVDNALMRFFIAKLYRLLDEGESDGKTQELHS